MKHPPDRHQKSLQIGLQKDWFSVFNEYGENNFSLYQNAKKIVKNTFFYLTETVILTRNK